MNDLRTQADRIAAAHVPGAPILSGRAYVHALFEAREAGGDAAVRHLRGQQIAARAHAAARRARDGFYHEA